MPSALVVVCEFELWVIHRQREYGFLFLVLLKIFALLHLEFKVSQVYTLYCIHSTVSKHIWELQKILFLHVRFGMNPLMIMHF